MRKFWKNMLQRYPGLNRVDRWLHTFTLPGLDGVAFYDVYMFFTAEIKRNSLAIRSRAIAFSFFLSLFPAILFVFSLVPFILGFFDPKHVYVYINGLIKNISPSPDVFKFLWTIIGPLVWEFTRKRAGLVTGSFLFTLVLASNGVVTMMSSFDKTYDDYHKRNAIMTRLVALKISALLAVLFIFSIILVFVGQNLLDSLFRAMHIKFLLIRLLFTIARYLSIVFLSLFSISLIYYYGPAIKKKYRFISTGSTLAAVLSVLTSEVFSYYLNHFARYNKLYGSVGTVLAILIWMNLNALVLLIGYEINVAIYYHRSIKQKHKTDTAENKQRRGIPSPAYVRKKTDDALWTPRPVTAEEDD